MHIMKSSRIIDIAITTLFVLGGFLLTQGVSAAWYVPPSGPLPARPAAQEPQAPLELATSTSQSLNWAGYVAQGGTYTAVSGSWVVPAVDTSQNTSLMADATWVGVGGVAARDLIQAGTQAITDETGDIIYQPWIETIPGDSLVVPFKVSPGDSMSVNITEIASGLWRVSLLNNTTGASYAKTITHDSSHSSAEWIEEMPALAEAGVFIPLDNFGTVNFTGGSAVKDSVALSIAGTGAQELSMTDGWGGGLAAPTQLSPDGASFSVARLPTQAVASFYVPERRHRAFFTGESGF